MFSAINFLDLKDMGENFWKAKCFQLSLFWCTHLHVLRKVNNLSESWVFFT